MMMKGVVIGGMLNVSGIWLYYENLMITIMMMIKTVMMMMMMMVEMVKIILLVLITLVC